MRLSPAAVAAIFAAARIFLPSQAASAESPRPLIHLEGYAQECAAYHSSFGVKICDHSTLVEHSARVFTNRWIVAATTTLVRVGGALQSPTTTVRDDRLSASAFAALQRVLHDLDIEHRRGRCNPWPDRPNANDPLFEQSWRISWYGAGKALNAPFGTAFRPRACSPLLLTVFDAILSAAQSAPASTRD